MPYNTPEKCKAYEERRREKKAVNDKAWRERTSARRRAVRRAYYLKHRKAIRAEQAEYYQLNKIPIQVKRRATAKPYQQRNTDHINARRRELARAKGVAPQIKYTPEERLQRRRESNRRAKHRAAAERRQGHGTLSCIVCQTAFVPGVRHVTCSTDCSKEHARRKKAEEHARYHVRYPGKNAAKTVAWRKANPDKFRAQKRRAYAKNPEPKRRSVQLWAQRHPEQHENNKNRDTWIKKAILAFGHETGLYAELCVTFKEADERRAVLFRIAKDTGIYAYLKTEYENGARFVAPSKRTKASSADMTTMNATNNPE